jgi:hypothetical protein
VDHPTEADLAAMRIERSRLRQHLHHHPADREARAALAANHRTAGHPDQAGRWGLLVPGCSTPAERRAFAAWVARTGEIDRARVLRLLFVPRRAYSRELDPGDELGGIEQVLAQERRLHYVETDTDTGEWLSNTVAGLVGLVVLFGLLGGTASTVIALTGGPGTPPLDTTWASPWSGFGGITAVVMVTLGLASATALAVRLRRRRRRLARRAARSARVAAAQRSSRL